MTLIKESWKAVVALLITAVMNVLVATSGGVSLGEGLRSAALSLLAGVLVWITPNQEKPVNEISGNFDSGQGGQGIVSLVCTVLGVIMIIIGAVHLISAALNNRTPNWILDIVLIVVGIVLIAARQYDLTGRNRF